MHNSRRSVLAAAADLSSLEIAGATNGSALADVSAVDKQIADLVRQSIEANSALMRGDIDSYRALIPRTDDFTLMSPFGGTPTRESDMTPERWQAIGRFFKNGTFAQEVVQAYGTADMIVLATIERVHVEVGGLPAQNWALRVTLVYRRQGSEWRLAHRHADPLAKGISVEQAAALGRGDAS
ncbi:nuclear transport factor 2 family protein [Mesorhizobium sp. Mes31]|uniref:YybH family protein n=1 Tax=Mesorhizobium sp. Mes31 TaxID=2926017 RepID=UPI00211995CA|nr:nuclear transport factor 2 family protein [Mesorhizobium sp. Mes31]